MEISASSFKATCLKLLDDVQGNKQEIIITKRGKPIARLVPYEPGLPASLLGLLRGTGKSVGDIVEAAEDWDLGE